MAILDWWKEAEVFIQANHPKPSDEGKIVYLSIVKEFDFHMMPRFRSLL